VMGFAVVHTHHGRRPHKILQTPKRHLKIQNNICGRAVGIVCGPRPVYLNTTAQPMAVDRTTAFCAVVWSVRSCVLLLV